MSKMTIDTEHDITEAVARASVYSLLAIGFALPTANRLSLIATGLLPGVTGLGLPVPMHEAVEQLASSLPTNLGTARDSHLALFPPITSQDAPGYETAYRGDGIFQQAALLADIAGFYRAHGLRAGGAEKERLDHITVELEFMAVVARKEARALQDGHPDAVDICRSSAAHFLRDHLGCWGPAFGRRAAAISDSPWYRSLGAMTALWVEQETWAVGVTPLETVERPLPQEPPDDGTCGPCPVPVRETMG